MNAQFRKLIDWLSENEITLDDFWTINITSNYLGLHGNFNQKLSAKLLQLGMKPYVMETGTVTYSLNNLTIYLS